MYFNISYQKQICNLFFPSIYSMLKSPWIAPNFTEPLGRTQRQEGRIGSKPLRVLQRFCELTENRRRVTAQKAAGVVWYTEQGLFPGEDSAKRRIFLVDKIWYPAKSEEVASSPILLMISRCIISKLLCVSIYQQWVIISRDVSALPQCQGPEGQACCCAYYPSRCQLQLCRFSIGHVCSTYRWRHGGSAVC